MSKPKRPETKLIKSSTCLCGAVHLTVSGVDKGAVLCHCSNCQKYSGSAFAHNYRLTKSQLDITKGQDLVREYSDSDTKSGNTLKRHFCGTCGCPLYLQNPQFPDLVILHTGTMQDRTGPTMELFKKNKHDWVGEVVGGKAKL